MWGQQRVGLVSRRLLLGVRRGCYAQGSSVLIFAKRRHGTSFSSSVSSSLTRLLLDRETASTSNRGELWKWYACGPTVYDSAHLGHARTYVSQDIIRRVLTNHFRQDVMFAMGVTDVDDKILRRAAEIQEDPRTLARRYEAEFWRDMRALNVLEPTAVLRVTEHMDAIIAYIQRIQANGFAYETSSGVYFDLEAFVKTGFTYGKLRRIEGVQGAGDEAKPASAAEGVGGGGGGDEAVVGREEKRSRRDFALWKLSKPGEEKAVCWDSPWGHGRPGWHIECSAMTHHLLRDRLEIHSGGIDLCFPHHTNEIAQCEAFGFRAEEKGGKVGETEKPGGGRFSTSSAAPPTAAGEEWVKVWLHTGHLYIQGLKMSKSLKNFITVQECLKRHHADDFRMFCLQRRYGANVDYSESAMQEARRLRRQFGNFVSLALSTHRDAAGLPTDTSNSSSISSISSNSSSVRSTSKRWNSREVAVMTELERVKTSVEKALLEGGIDTPEVLRLLQGLVATGHVYMGEGREGGSEGGCVEEVLRNVAGYVIYVLRLFGVQSIGDAMQSFSSSSSLSSSSLPTTAAITETLSRAVVDFRARVRAAALEDRKERDCFGQTGTTVQDKSKSNSSAELSHKLLRLCDDFRDGELARLGLQVKDLEAGRCHWTLGVPPPPPPPPPPSPPPSPFPATAAAAAPATVHAAASLVGRQHQQPKASVALSELFKQGPYEGRFSSFDELEIPTADAEGRPLSKNLRAKLEKQHARHVALLAGVKEKEEGNGDEKGRE